MAAIMHNSSVYLRLAAENAAKIHTTEPLEPNNREAIISIVFAASALEASINERAEWAAQICKEGSQPEVIQTFASVLSDAEKSRAPLESKYLLARWVLTGTAYDQGVNPYQDFSLLIGLRNSLVHLKPTNSLLKRLEGKGILLPHDDDPWGISSDGTMQPIAGVWTERVATKEMAMWSCKSASAFVCDFLDCLPKEDLGTNFSVHSGDYVRKYWADPWDYSCYSEGMGIEP